MKTPLTLLFILFQLLAFSQNDTLLKVELKKVKTDDLYSYFAFDSIADLESKTIIIKYLWIENGKLESYDDLKVGFNGKFIAEPIGPDRQIVGNDTLHIRGHARPRPSFFIDGIELENGFEKMRIDYYYLKEIKR